MAVASRFRVVTEFSRRRNELIYEVDLRMKGLLKLADPVMGVLFRRIAGRAKDGLERTLAAPAPGGRA